MRLLARGLVMSDFVLIEGRRTLYLFRVAVACLGACALVWLLETGTPVFLPLTCALVAGVVFAPLVDFLDRLRAPRVASALLVMVIVVAALILAVLSLYPVIFDFIHRVPLLWAELQYALSGLKLTLESVKEVQQRVIETLSAGDQAGTAADGGAGVPVPGISDVLGYLPSIAAQIMVFVGVLYFFLLTRSDLYAFMDRNTSVFSKEVLCRPEVDVSRYFLTTTAINAVFGLLVVLMLSTLGMPNAIYWGLAAFLANFILYLGPISFAACLLMGGLVAFDGAMSFAPALIYMLMNMTEGQFVTPSLVGKHMSVNPLLVFVSLIFWIWLWGPLGGIIAIPLLVWLGQVNETVKALRETGSRGSKVRARVA